MASLGAATMYEELLQSLITQRLQRDSASKSRDPLRARPHLLVSVFKVVSTHFL
jgi:hypothetical protein